jgi:hypothetical protein
MGETATALHKSVSATVARDNEAYLAVVDEEPIANTLKANRGKGGGGIGPEETLVAERTSSSEGSPARTSPSPANGRDSAAPAPASTGRSSDSFEALALFGPASFSSRMSPASFPLAAVEDAESAARFYAGIESEAVQELLALTAETREAIPTPSSPAGAAPPATRQERSASGTQEPTSRWSAPRWRTSGTASATEFSTADTSEWPSDGGGSSCSLSSILEQEVDPRYYLSPRAALGILSRAGRRGRELPPHLREALEAVVRTDAVLWKEYEAAA